MEESEDVILFFVKYPEPGCVKTRLSKELGADLASTVYRNMALDLRDKLQAVPFPFMVCFSPEKNRDRYMDWLGEAHPYFPQKGAHLGERMKSAFEEVFTRGYKRAILMGSDIPDLPSDLLEEALGALHTHAAVLGPALDGGYYLVGFRHDTFFPGIFHHMPWGENSVFRETLSLLKAAEQKVYILPAWRDVDTLEDLKELMVRAEQTGFSGSRTLSHLARLPEECLMGKGQMR